MKYSYFLGASWPPLANAAFSEHHCHPNLNFHHLSALFCAASSSHLWIFCAHSWMTSLCGSYVCETSFLYLQLFSSSVPAASSPHRCFPYLLRVQHNWRMSVIRKSWNSQRSAVRNKKSIFLCCPGGNLSIPVIFPLLMIARGRKCTKCWQASGPDEATWK